VNASTKSRQDADSAGVQPEAAPTVPVQMARLDVGCEMRVSRAVVTNGAGAYRDLPEVIRPAIWPPRADSRTRLNRRAAAGDVTGQPHPSLAALTAHVLPHDAEATQRQSRSILKAHQRTPRWSKQRRTRWLSGS
jgi:hypothetical protein